MRVIVAKLLTWAKLISQETNFLFPDIHLIREYPNNTIVPQIEAISSQCHKRLFILLQMTRSAQLEMIDIKYS